MRKPLGKIRSESKLRQVRRKLKIRKVIVGTTDKPRICVGKTNKHLRVQVVDDSVNKTLFSVQTFGKSKVGTSANKESAKLIGAKVAEQLKAHKIESVLFDRNGNMYTGVIATVADAMRENGIKL
jgi:large subunit ribosomal protein L18